MNAFLRSSLPAFAKRNPSVEIHVAPRPNHHPIIIADYINGRQKSICVRNLTNEGVKAKAELLRDGTGEKNRKVGKPVSSLNESVRGIWSPLHGGRIKI